jgi:methyl-accepting chemotaxis protein
MAEGNADIAFNRIEDNEIGDLKKAFLSLAEGAKVQSGALERLAAADFSVTIAQRGENDVVAKSINHLADAQREYVRDISNVMGRIDGGDLSAAIEMDYKGDFGPIKVSVNHMTRSLRGIIDELKRELADLAEGDLGAVIKSDFAGDFNEVKSAFNASVQKQKTYVEDIAQAMGQILEGRLQVRLTADYHGDFLSIRDSILGTSAMIHAYIDEIRRVLSALAGKDFTAAVGNEFKGDFADIRTSMDAIGDSLSDVFAQIDAAASHVSAGSGHVSDEAMSLASGAQKQNEDIQELVNVSGQIAAQATDNAKKATDAIALSRESIKGVEQGSRQMGSLISAISEISDASSKIGLIINTINGIAFQTNLLALNASVEAARAGSAGKGFSVVAEEVRNLANKTSKATKDIAQLIANSTAAVKKGSEIAGETAGTFEGIVAGAKKTAEIITEIADETKAQSTETMRINSGLDDILGVVTANSAASQEAAAASQELSSQAQVLKSLVDMFKLKNRS